ncbi:hypothetical protein CWC22_016910 [Pseudoalteromonas rubra]|uniref:Uncharacterized protein n=1 Tax=Pseudoalteromonas rubra TaxID=43658 RepID=A0A7S8BLD7_9GAMM|nr:hypothetical protein CWC22_016910 [Pseudoalteromonas rubra]
MSPESYLRGEPTNTNMYELADGQVYAMTGTSANHELIVEYLHRTQKSSKRRQCELFGSDMKMRGHENFCN